MNIERITSALHNHDNISLGANVDSNNEILTHRTRIPRHSGIISTDYDLVTSEIKRKKSKKLLVCSPACLVFLVCVCLGLLATIITVSVLATRRSSTTTTTTTTTTVTTTSSTSTTSSTATTTTSTTTTTTMPPPNCTTCLVYYNLMNSYVTTSCTDYCNYVNGCCDYGRGIGINTGGGAGRNYSGTCSGTCYTGYGLRTGFGLDPCCDDGISNTCCLNTTGQCCNATNCCPTGCCNNTCCGLYGGSCCNNMCCNGPCCNNTCCAGNRTCCDGKCCDGNCCNGVCCDGACCGGVCYPGIFCCNGNSYCPTGICCSGVCCLSNANTTCTIHSSYNPNCFSRRACVFPYNSYFCCCN